MTAPALSSGILSFIFVPGSTPSAQNTNLTLTCTAASVISGLTATSSNGWRFIGGTHGGTINYTLATTSVISPCCYDTDVNNTWSGTSGSGSPVQELSSSMTINSSVSPIVIGLQIAPSSISSTAAVDIYSDSVTFTTTY